jgi:Trichohyalin-plectin-homology domain
MLKRERIK